MKGIQTLIPTLLTITSLYGQFVGVKVSVDNRHLNENDKKATASLGQQIKTFYEKTRWDEEYRNLKIPLTIKLIFKEVSNTGNEQIYTAQCFFSNEYDQHYLADSFQFPYSQSLGIFYTPGNFDPLASTLQYYGYIILAGVVDSHLPFGGSSFYEKTQEIALKGQSSHFSEDWVDRIELSDHFTNNQAHRLSRFYMYLSIEYLHQKKYAEAGTSLQKMIENLEKAFKQFPGDPYTRILLKVNAHRFARLPSKLKNKEEILRKLITLDPDNKDHYKKGLSN